MSKDNAFKAELTLANGMLAVLNMRSKIAYERTYGKTITEEISGLNIKHPSYSVLCQLLYAFLLPNNPDITEDEVMDILEDNEGAPLQLISMGFENLTKTADVEPEAEVEKKTTATKKKSSI